MDFAEIAIGCSGSWAAVQSAARRRFLSAAADSIGPELIVMAAAETMAVDALVAAVDLAGLTAAAASA